MEQAALLVVVVRCQGRWRAKRLARQAHEAQSRLLLEKAAAAEKQLRDMIVAGQIHATIDAEKGMVRVA